MKYMLLITSSIAIGLSVVGAVSSILTGRADLFAFALALGVSAVASVEVSK